MPYGGGPAEYAAMQQQQRQEQMNNILRMFMTMKQYQNEQQWRQKEWESKQGQQAFERPLEERRVSAYEKMAGASGQSDFDTRLALGRQMGKAGQELMNFARGIETPEEAAKKAEAVGYAGETGRRKAEKEIPIPKPPSEPTTYDKQKRDLDQALKDKKITEGQYYQSLFGLKQETPPSPNVRDTNTRIVRDAFKTYREFQDVTKNARKMVKQTGGRPVHETGYFLDMPEKYNVAVLNKNDGAASQDDLITIKKYDDMLKFFQDGLISKGVRSFKDFMRLDVAKESDLDKNQIKFWYDIYGK